MREMSRASPDLGKAVRGRKFSPAFAQRRPCLIAYGTALFLSLYGLRHRRGPSIAAVLSGLLASGINCLVLVLLARYDLALVYPFVSFGSSGTWVSLPFL